MTSKSWVLGCAVVVAACAHKHAPPKSQGQVPDVSANVPPEPGNVTRDAFTCDNGKNVATQFFPDDRRMTVSDGESFARLEQVESGSGSKFSNGAVTFWSHGDEAMLEAEGVATHCQRNLSR